MHKAEILHQRPVVMNQKTRRAIAGVEMLMPAKNRNTENISLAPVVAHAVDDAMTSAPQNVDDRLRFTSSLAKLTDSITMRS